MNQLTQKLKTGKMQILDVPLPNLRPGTVMIQNYYSLVSAGTEGSTVSAARKGYIGKAKDRPQQVKQVIKTLKDQGPVQTYRAVMKKLDAHSPLGYSCVGRVIDLAPDVTEFKVSDLVGCGGKSASHAEVVSVPVNLCAHIPHSSFFEADKQLQMAAYNTLGAIAMQGVRQADLRLGENCAVVGLGLLGQLACLLLRASGVKVIGIDISKAMVDIATQHCADLAVTRNSPGIEVLIADFTAGFGCDAVIITAATNSLDPINFAGAISRKKGTIVVVGAVPTGFDREPHFYQKELTVKMSCSYGPGRYDPVYEEKGRDYPYAYVRWTEKRNMQAFQELIANGSIDISYLTTHTFGLEDAPAAYDMIMARSEPFIGILIEYDQKKEISRGRVEISKKKAAGRIVIGFIGAGSYAQSHLIPNIPTGGDVTLKGVMTGSSTGSRSVADRFGFEFCTGNEHDIFSDPAINTVFIATRHDSHGRYVIEALKSDKNVFVEKPLCLAEEELAEITQIFIQPDSPVLMVGFNRRFSPLTVFVREKIGQGTMSMLYRVNAGSIPSNSWIQDQETGGGRILGEVCHFIDYLTCMNGSLPVSVYAVAMADSQNLDDTLNVSLQYQNGSVGTILYCANGSKDFPKEYVEVYRNGITAVINDYREASVFGVGNKPIRKNLQSQNKGQKDEVHLFLQSLAKGEALIPVEQLLNSTVVSFKVVESIRTGKAVSL
jgi:polar amino acid transport system substrate-binding protein